MIDNEKVSVLISDPTKKKTKVVDEKELFVGNLPPNITEQVLKSYFSKFGDLRVRLFKNTAFLHFESIVMILIGICQTSINNELYSN